MKHLLVTLLFAGLTSASAYAQDANVQEEDSAGVSSDESMQNQEVNFSSRWAFLGCAYSKVQCRERALSKGYTEIKTFATCGARNQYPYSCFAR